MGLTPSPGRLVVRLSAVNTSPARMGFAATMLLRATGLLGASLAVTCLRPSPRAASTWRTASTIALNSAGSRLAFWSGPGRLLSSVKCFSMTVAPSTAAATSHSQPGVWSESPTGRPNWSNSSSMALRLASA